MMNFLNIPDDYIISDNKDKITYSFNFIIVTDEDKVKFCLNDCETSFMNPEDRFVSRIQFNNLNPCFPAEHLEKEIKIKNILDDAVSYLSHEKYSKAIDLLDDVIYYDSDYAEAILYKSKAFYGQGHFVKSLRHYKKAVKADGSLKNIEYHKLLLKKSSQERDNFPKIKRNIYAGDEYFAKGEFKKALESYNKALVNPTKFKDKILSKLLNKKATALLKLKLSEDALECFKRSFKLNRNDYANFNIGVLEYEMNGCIPEEFKKPLKISKSQLIKKASILNQAGEFNLALTCLDEYFENQFLVNEIYIKALKLRLSLLKALEMDTGDDKEIFKRLNLSF